MGTLTSWYEETEWQKGYDFRPYYGPGGHEPAPHLSMEAFNEILRNTYAPALRAEIERTSLLMQYMPKRRARWYKRLWRKLR